MQIGTEAPTPSSLGFIGLGAMGISMARNLHTRGLLTAVWNRTQEKATSFAAETGCPAAASSEALASRCDVIVTCVSADADLLGLVSSALPHLRNDALWIDCSTTSADTARTAATQLASRHAHFLDAPVSGGVEGARNATLAIMVGGEEAAFIRARPILEAMGRTITYMGPTGAGQATKATNQIMCAGVIQAVCEAMAFAKAQGLPLDRLIDTLGKGAGSSWYFVNRAPNILRESYPAGFRVQLHKKDLEICRAMAARFGVQLPLVEMTLLHYRRLIEQGHGDEDISTLFRLKEALFQSSTSKPPTAP